MAIREYLFMRLFWKIFKYLLTNLPVIVPLWLRRTSHFSSKPKEDTHMLIHWQSHQDYLNFLHETKVHLDSSQRTRLLLGFGPVREKLRLLNLDPVMEYLSSFYSPVGRR